MDKICTISALKGHSKRLDKKLLLGLTLSFKNLQMCKFFSNFVLAMSNYKERGRMELAMLYFPQLSGKKAWLKLKSWIEYCQPLAKELAQLGYTGRQRTFTPRQVNRIVHYLGEY